MCHLILFLPVFALPVFWVFPIEAALPAYLFVLATSLVIYFKIFESMRQHVLTGREGIVGKTGLVIEDINPEGKIRYGSEIWNAKTTGKGFTRGDHVRISGIKRLMLRVDETYNSNKES